MNITTFMTWFINSFIQIGSQLLGYLDNLKIYGTISMLDFMITITIIGAFIGMIITAPKLTSVQASIKERDRASAREEERYNAWWESKR